MRSPPPSVNMWADLIEPVDSVRNAAAILTGPATPITKKRLVEAELEKARTPRKVLRLVASGAAADFAPPGKVRAPKPAGQRSIKGMAVFTPGQLASALAARRSRPATLSPVPFDRAAMDSGDDSDGVNIVLT